MLAKLGPGALAGAVEAGDRVSGDPQPDTRLAVQRQAATGRPRSRPVAAICRIVRPVPQINWPTTADRRAQCVACSAEIERVPPAVAVVEVSAATISLVAGICALCSARDDRDLIAATYSALRALMPSLRPISPGGSA
jgi:hypothetical protein